jgi:hypothetical protein
MRLKSEDVPVKVDDHGLDALQYGIKTTEGMWARACAGLHNSRSLDKSREVGIKPLNGVVIARPSQLARRSVRAPSSPTRPTWSAIQEQRLRSPFPCIALTCRNVLPDVLPGRVSGATRLVEVAGYAGVGGNGI